IFAFFSYYFQTGGHTDTAIRNTLDLMVQRAFSVMSNDVLISIPLFVFMGYLVERSNLIEKLFRSLHIALARIPASLAVATLVTCAVFATATGIVGAVVTLMGLLAFPAMLKAGYNVKVSAGAITAGGCLGILIPPSVLLIVYGAVAGVSVVQLYAGAFFPGFMLAGLYIGYIIVLAKWKPSLMPPLPESERRIALPPFAERLRTTTRNALVGLWRGVAGGAEGIGKRTVLAQFFITLLPALLVAGLLFLTYQAATAPEVQASTAGLQEAGSAGTISETQEGTGLSAPPEEGSTGLAEPPAQETSAPHASEPQAEKAAEAKVDAVTEAIKAPAAERLPAPTWFWIVVAIAIVVIAL